MGQTDARTATLRGENFVKGFGYRPFRGARFLLRLYPGAAGNPRAGDGIELLTGGLG